MYYAQLNHLNICVGVSILAAQVPEYNYFERDGNQVFASRMILIDDFDLQLLGKTYTDSGWEYTPLHALIYSGNGAEEGGPPQQKEYWKDAEISVDENSGNLSVSGKEFSGWNTLEDGSGTAYLPGAVFTMGGTDVVLYAQWEAE